MTGVSFWLRAQRGVNVVFSGRGGYVAITCQLYEVLRSFLQKSSW